jgi:Stage II sporulation protein.
VPPATIRVLRTSGAASGTVQVVDFKTYVQYVMAAEWPPTWTDAALQTGAMAIKQYAWYYTMH